MSKVIEQFLKYISIDTTSIDDVEEYPSSDNQWILAEMLKKEMDMMGFQDVNLDSYGYVTGTIPSNIDEDDPVNEVPVLGFLAHMDTSNAVSGKDIKAKIYEYSGGDICLNEEKDIWIRESEFPELEEYLGEKIIVTDGTTLLGADDKAGIAEILAASEILLKKDAPKHGRIRICFTPDEEVGNGTKYLDVKKYGAKYAYTVDGGQLGHFEYENFNAASATIVIHGKSMHPGSSKNRMVNAILIGMEFQSMIPSWEAPSHTEDYEGFYHLDEIQGDVELCKLGYIIRDHSRKLFEEKKERMLKITEYLNEKYGEGTIECILQDSYYNMREIIDQYPLLIENALDAYRKCGVEPVVEPIRGGTDGARLSFMGLPCPNLSTGGHNFHSVREFIPVKSMEKMVEVIIKLATSFVDSDKDC